MNSPSSCAGFGPLFSGAVPPTATNTYRMFVLLNPGSQKQKQIAARSAPAPRFVPRFLALLAGYENLTAPLFALSR
jgi:hypothetical protein